MQEPYIRTRENPFFDGLLSKGEHTKTYHNVTIFLFF